MGEPTPIPRRFIELESEELHQHSLVRADMIVAIGPLHWSHERQAVVVYLENGQVTETSESFDSVKAKMVAALGAEAGYYSGPSLPSSSKPHDHWR